MLLPPLLEAALLLLLTLEVAVVPALVPAPELGLLPPLLLEPELELELELELVPLPDALAPLELLEL